MQSLLHFTFVDAIIFVSVDILSLVIQVRNQCAGIIEHVLVRPVANPVCNNFQAIGGGMASIAVQTIDGNPATGGHVMLGTSRTTWAEIQHHP